MTPLFLIVMVTTAPNVPTGPSAMELGIAIHAAPQVNGLEKLKIDTIRSLQCRVFEEEPTEYLCRFQARPVKGPWRRHSAVVAIDQGGWVLLSLD